MKMLSVILFGVMNTFADSKGKIPPTTTKGSDGKIPPPVTTKQMCYDTIYNNPCTDETIDFYFPSCSSCCNFIQCDASGNAFDMPCGSGTSWDPIAYTCNYKNEACKDECPKYTQKPTKYTPQKSQEPKGGPQKTQKPIKIPDFKCYDIEYNNPCNKEHTSKYGFYFKSCDSCCDFIQCDAFGNSWEMPCSAGTFWDQRYHTCNHNNGQCNQQCGIPKSTTQKPTKYQQQQQQQQNPQNPKIYTTTTTQKPQKYYQQQQQQQQQQQKPKIYTTTTTQKPQKYYQQQQQQQQQQKFKPQKPIYTTSTTTQKPIKYTTSTTTQKPIKYTTSTTTHKPTQQQQQQQQQNWQEPVKGDDGCYDRFVNNPCTEENVESDKLFWESCTSCCNFIQCDEVNVGDAYDMPCPAGTYFDKDTSECNFNEGQCNEQCGKNKVY